MTPELFSSLQADLDCCMTGDRRRLARWLDSIASAVRAGRPRDRQLAKLTAELQASKTRRQHRQDQLPQISYPPLPVSDKREDIAAAIRDHQVVVICGETGSGKTTQLPKICLDLGRGIAGMIGHTQPRRLAARSVARRIADELKSPLGQKVGFKVRFDDQTKPSAYIKLMTDGILLAETQNDRLLDQYDTIIIDEAHERSLNIDFLLGYLKQLLPQRPDLKLIITSATIDPERFSQHFDDAPILMVSGRTYPVETRYRPILVEEEDEEDPNMEQAIVAAVREVSSAGPGDILVFLSGEREIRQTAEELKTAGVGGEILPLYSRLSADEQNRIFAPHGKRRIVLSTNVAETSLTVPGIRYVIDPGLARISRYSARTKVQRLPIERVSQASANQRMGRCGRMEAGICIRLYSEEDFLARPLFTEPEILRTNLASVILQMKALQLGAVEDFPFIEPPDGRLIRDGYQTLHEIGAVDDTNELTPIGWSLAKLPTDPRIGRMILAGADEGCLKEVLVIAAALSIQDPRERPMDNQDAADEAHFKFRDTTSDFLGFLKLWDWYHKQAKHLGSSKLRKLCIAQFVSYLRMREWVDVHRQLKELADELKLNINGYDAPPDNIHRALLTGLLGNVGFRAEGYEYIGARGRKFAIHPGSALFKHKPDWLMAAEMVETTKLYARTIAPVRPGWVEKLAPHLVKYAYTELRWRREHARVEADERVTMYGMVLVPQRTVHYGPINPPAAREIFIRFALVGGDYRTRAPYMLHNRQLIAQVRDLEAKARRHDLLVEQQVLFDFYAARIPEVINAGPRFERWRKDVERDNPQHLFMQWDNVYRAHAPVIDPSVYPDELIVGESTLPLVYAFEPGEAHDGVTLTVPLPLLSQLTPERFEWLVPGHLLEKITALIKSLPTATRRNFVPVPQFAQAALQYLQEHASTLQHRSLYEALSTALFQLTGVEAPPNEFRLDALPDHLHMRFAVVDDEGKVMASGRDLRALQNKLAPQVTHAFSALDHQQFTKDGLTDWTVGDLPESVEVKRHGMLLVGYPALVEVDDHNVSLRLLDSPEAAAQAHRRGLIRLFQLQLQPDFHHLAHELPDKDIIFLHYALLGTPQQLRRDILDAIAEQTFLAGMPPVKTQAEFRARRLDGRQKLFEIAATVVKLVRQILELYHAITLYMERPHPAHWTPAYVDIQEQLAHLLPKGFVSNTPYEWLVHFPRYLTAVQARLDKLKSGGLDKDARNMDEIEPLWQHYLHRLDRHRTLRIEDPELTRYRYMVEEMRVSLWAQQLATAIPVSAKRMQRQLELVR